MNNFRHEISVKYFNGILYSILNQKITCARSTDLIIITMSNLQFKQIEHTHRFNKALTQNKTKNKIDKV